ncbi:MAG: DUF2400 family protein [Bacteroidales bacterium]|nr:DUF2400 family protein [Candidatus Liminaster caballi]
MKVCKESLDRISREVFDVAGFRQVDPCGLVYELTEHTQRQLDIELGALLTAMISWGNRKCIRRAARRMLADEMQWHPADFILSGRFVHSYGDGRDGNCCVYRTLNRETFIAVCRNLHDALVGASSASHDAGLTPFGLPSSDLTIERCFSGLSMKEAIRRVTELLSPARIGTMDRSACKRVCMFMRWMVRQQAPDFGLWKSRSASELYAVLDVHVCTLAAPLMTRRQASWAACEELTSVFRQWDPVDPLKYDIALMTLADHPEDE